MLDLGPPKQRAVLALLLLAEGRVVSADRLIESAWGDDPPSRALASLQVYVSKLRSVLDVQGPRGIARRSPGYVLAPDWLDVSEFRRLTREAVEGVRASAWSDSVEAAGSAVGLWRGPFLDDFGDEQWVNADAVRLDELYAQCMEAWVTGLLGMNRAGEAVTRTQTMIEAYPLRERCWWLRMIALHRAGRSPEALDAYQHFSGDLNEQLGLEPGPQIRELQTAILRHDQAIASWPTDDSGLASPVLAQEPSQGRSSFPSNASADDQRGTADRRSPVEPKGVVADASSTDHVEEDGSFGMDQPVSIVGRVAELAVLDRVLDDVADSRYRWVVLTGRAGIGKTRLAAEASLRAVRRGIRSTWTSCPDDAGTPAWWPLRALAAELGVDPDGIFLPPEGVDADTVRFTVYERLSRLLSTSAAEQPLLVVIDDAQWLDAASIRALAHLAHTQRLANVGIVLTVRDSERRPEFDEVLGAIGREPFTVHLRVEPLDAPSSSELLRLIAGDSVTPADAFALVKRVGGNPLLLSEYARLPPDERRDGEIPLAARGLLERRLRRLPDGVLSVLGAAGVIGESFELDLLAKVTGLDLLELLDRLDAAVAETIIAPSDSGVGYQFRHGLMRDAITAQLTVLRRQAIHARVAEALSHTGRDSRTLIRRAQHVSAAMPVLGPTAVIEACSEAARAAEDVWDWDAAAQQWKLAQDALQVLPEADDDARDDLLLAQLAALSRAGRAQTVLDTVDAALDTAAGHGLTATVGRLSALLLRTSGAWPWSAYGADPSALLARLEGLVGSVAYDEAALARVLAAQAVGNCYHLDADVPDHQSSAAIRVAERLGDPDVLADALLGRVLAFSGVAARAEEQIALLDRLEHLPHLLQETDDVLRHNLLTLAAFSLGDMDAVTQNLQAGMRGSDRLRLPLTRVQLRYAQGREAQWQGDFDRSEELAATARQRHQETELYAVEVTADTTRMALLRDRGRLAGASMSDAVDDPRVRRIWTALVAAETGDHESGRRAAEDFLARPGPEYWYTLADRTWFAHAVADLGLTDCASALLDLLASRRPLVASLGQTASAGPVALATGKLHALLGDQQAARADLALSERLCRQGGGMPDLLRTRLALVLLDSPSAERSTALHEIAAEADRLGMAAVASSALGAATA